MCRSMAGIQSSTAEIRRGKRRNTIETRRKYDVRICNAGRPQKDEAVSEISKYQRLSNIVTYTTRMRCAAVGLLFDASNPRCGHYGVRSVASSRRISSETGARLMTSFISGVSFRRGTHRDARRAPFSHCPANP